MGSNKASGATPSGNNHPSPAPTSRPETQLFVVPLEIILTLIRPHGPPPTMLPKKIAPSAQKEDSQTRSMFKPAARHAPQDGTKKKRTNNIVCHALPENSPIRRIQPSAKIVHKTHLQMIRQCQQLSLRAKIARLPRRRRLVLRRVFNATPVNTC